MLDKGQVRVKRDSTSQRLKLVSGLLDRPGGQLYMLPDSTGRVHKNEHGLSPRRGQDATE